MHHLLQPLSNALTCESAAGNVPGATRSSLFQLTLGQCGVAVKNLHKAFDSPKLSCLSVSVGNWFQNTLWIPNSADAQVPLLNGVDDTHSWPSTSAASQPQVESSTGIYFRQPTCKWTPQSKPTLFKGPLSHLSMCFYLATLTRLQVVRTQIFVGVVASPGPAAPGIPW